MSRETRTDRRSFVGLTAAMLGLAPFGAVAGTARERPPAEPWDLRWLEQLTGKHKQVFDFTSGLPDPRGSPFTVVRNWMNAYRDVFGLQHPQVNAVVGIAFSGFPCNASDTLWRTFGLGEKWQVKDSDTGAWSDRNIFLRPVEKGGAPQGTGVLDLQERGVIFWQCNNALLAVVRRLREDPAHANREPEGLRQELIAGLVPGVKVVPAHTMLIGLVQEHGCAYQSIWHP